MARFKPIIDGAIGGESWQNEPRKMAWDRPPQFARIDEGLDYVFKQFRNPGRAKQLLNLLKAGMPIDMLTEQVLMKGFADGKFGAPALLQMVAPTQVMMWRMAERAGIRPMTSQDKDEHIDFDPTEMLLAQQAITGNQADKAVGANEMSTKELSDPTLVDRPGFMKFRPVLKGK